MTNMIARLLFFLKQQQQHWYLHRRHTTNESNQTGFWKNKNNEQFHYFISCSVFSSLYLCKQIKSNNQQEYLLSKKKRKWEM